MPGLTIDYLLPLKLLPMAVLVVLFLAALGAPLIAACCEMAARGRSFPDKLARQLASLGVRCGFLFLGVFCVGLAVMRLRPDVYPAGAWLPSLFVGGYALLVVGLTTAYLLSWSAMKDRKGLHKALGVAAWLGAADVTFVFLGLKRYGLLHLNSFPTDMGLWDLLMDMCLVHAGSALWPIATQALVLGACAGGAVGLAWLLWRRNRDDFGRDYYTYALKAAARWALWAGLLQLGAQAWLLAALRPRVSPFGLDNPALVYWGAGAALTLAACLLWSVVARSQAPLRQKPAMIGALLCLALAGAAQATAVIKILF